MDSIVFKDAYNKTKRKAELLEIREKLKAECKLLDAEVRKLQIIAHNEQADVENLESPGIKSMLLELTGKKQERLEKEQGEARNAVQNYEFAKMRRESVGQRLIARESELDSLGACEVALQQLLQIPANDALLDLTQLLSDIPRILEDISSLTGTLTKVSQWGAARAATSSTSGLAGTDDTLRAIENKAQDALDQLKSNLSNLQKRAAAHGIQIDLAQLEQVESNYLTDLYTSALIDIRVDKITVMLRQIRLQLDAAFPKLTQTASEQTIRHLHMLLDAAGKAMT